MSTGQTRPDAFLGFSQPRAAMQVDAADKVTGLARAPMEGTLDFFPPHLLRTQRLLPHLVEPQRRIGEAILLRDGALSRWLKEIICLAIAGEWRNRYGAAMHWHALRRLAPDASGRENPVPGATTMSPPDRAVLHHALRVGRIVSPITTSDFAPMRSARLTDSHIVEAVAVAALAVFECTVSTGLQVGPDFDVPDMAALERLLAVDAPRSGPTDDRPLAAAQGADVDQRVPLAFLEEAFGFVPNVFRILMARPDVADAVASALRQFLLPEHALSHTQKQNILLVISAANLNTYCVAAHCQLLRGLGTSVERANQIAVSHRHADLPDADKVLLDAAVALSRRPGRFGPAVRRQLRRYGFDDRQILEAVLVCGFAQFLNALSVGLAAEPDFEPPPAFRAVTTSKRALPAAALSRQAEEDVSPSKDSDPDWTSVLRIQQGDVDAFEDLVRRHGPRIRGMLAGMLRRDEDIEDAVQDTFLGAFQHIGSFHGRSKFLTWLTRIAINTALQRLRRRRKLESLDESLDSEEHFSPRHIQAWQEDPATLYSKTVLRRLVLNAVRELPLKYRVVVVLRDLQQLSTAETAATLDLAVPGVKARLLRGRLMMREALAPHFMRNGNGRGDD